MKEVKQGHELFLQYKWLLCLFEDSYTFSYLSLVHVGKSDTEQKSSKSLYFSQ